MIFLIDNRKCNTKKCKKYTVKTTLESDPLNANITYHKTSILCCQPREPYTYFLIVQAQVQEKGKTIKQYTWAEPVEEEDLIEYENYPQYNPYRNRKEYMKNYHKIYYQTHKEDYKRRRLKLKANN